MSAPERDTCQHFDIQATGEGIFCVECGIEFEDVKRALAAEQERDEHLKWRTVEQEIGDKQRADLAALREQVRVLTPLARLGLWAIDTATETEEDRECTNAIFTGAILDKATELYADTAAARAVLAKEGT